METDLGNFLRDLRFTARLIRRKPASSLVIILALAVGIGLGLVAAIAGTRFIATLLYQVSPNDPMEVLRGE